MMKDFRLLAAAYTRGYYMNNGGVLREDLIRTPLGSLTPAQIDELIDIGKLGGLKMYRFKEKDDLPRVRKTLGFLKGFQPGSLLDVGSGRGVFLFPFLRDFPGIPVTSLDILPDRVGFLKNIRDGGVETLEPIQADICEWDAPDRSFDVVTLLEVLEHIPDAEKAAANAFRLAKRYVAVSVPSKPDNNPEHIHLLTKDILTDMFTAAGAKKLIFDGVNGHLLMIAVK